MFFMFHILVFTIYFCEKSCTANRENNLNLSEYYEGNAGIFMLQRNNKDNVGNKEHDLTTQNPVLRAIKNLPSTNHNLKSNVFDKMLSDEMLSIKQRFFERDLAYTSNIQKISKAYPATPTLQVKQKWHAVDMFTKTLSTDGLENIGATKTEAYELKPKTSLIMNEPKIKSLDVRSLSGHSNSMHGPEIKCNCANSNANHQCKHGDDCTRKPLHGSAVGNSPYPAMYMPYEAYFVSDNNENLFQSTLYHPQVINELKIPKTTKNRKPSHSQDGDLYYDNDWEKRRIHKGDSEIVMNIDYDIEDNKDPGLSLNCIHEDLKEVYNKGMKRKCYCSSSRSTRSHRIVHFICAFVSLSGSFGLDLLLLKYKVLS